MKNDQKRMFPVGNPRPGGRESVDRHTTVPSELAAMMRATDPAVKTVMGCVYQYFDRYGRPPHRARVLVGLSGGGDSVALLAVMLCLSGEHGWRVGAAHVNYGLRGDASDRDETFCRELAARWHVELYVDRVGCSGPPPRGNRQQWARDRRYRFFDRIADRCGYSHIAVGHTLNDRAETTAAAVIDTEGTFALCGIPPVRGRVIRPLFFCRRDTLHACLAMVGIRFRTDASNHDLQYRRNWIRHRVLPVWEKQNPRVVEGLSRMAEQLGRQHDFLRREAERQVNAAVIEARAGRIVLDAARLAEYDLCLDPFVLRVLIRRVGVPILPRPSTVRRFEELRRWKRNGRVEQGEMVIERSKGFIACGRRQPDTASALTVVPIHPGTTQAFGLWRIRTRLITAPGPQPFDDHRRAFLDVQKVSWPVSLRPPRCGDRYDPIGLRGHKKLADLFSERGVPVFRRWETPVITDEAGILWPVGCPVAERAKFTGNTDRLLQVVAVRK